LEDDENFGSLEGLEKFSSPAIRSGEKPTILDLADAQRASQSADMIQLSDPKSADDHVAVTSPDEEYHDSEQEDFDEEIATIGVKKIERDQEAKKDDFMEKDSRQPVFRIDSAAATDRNPHQEVGFSSAFST
jgi:hypothetical protein